MNGYRLPVWFFPFLLVLSMTSAVGLFAQTLPLWARRLPELPNLPGFYQGLGTAQVTDDLDADWEKAAGKARSQILQQIRVKVVNTVAARIEETASGREASLSEAFSSTTEQLTTGTLDNLPLERWYDEEKNVLYAYGAVSKAELELKLEEQLRAAAASARVFYSAARKSLDAGDIYLAITDYLNALKVVVLAEMYLGTSLSGALREEGTRTPMIPVLQSELCRVLNTVRIRITGGNEQAAERGRALPVPLTGSVLAETATGPRPVRNLPLAAAFLPPASGTLTGTARTDEEGGFLFSVAEITGGTAANVIRVSPSLAGLDLLGDRLVEATRCLLESSADFRFTLRTRATVTIALCLVEYNLTIRRPKSSVQEEIQQQLLGDRYRIIEESQMLTRIPDEKITAALRSGNFQPVVSALAPVADVAIVGLISTQQRTNPVAGIYFATGTAAIRAIETKTGRILGAVSVENEKGGGATYEVAGIRALQTVAKRAAGELKARLDEALK